MNWPSSLLSIFSVCLKLSNSFFFFETPFYVAVVGWTTLSLVSCHWLKKKETNSTEPDVCPPFIWMANSSLSKNRIFCVCKKKFAKFFFSVEFVNLSAWIKCSFLKSWKQRLAKCQTFFLHTKNAFFYCSTFQV